MQRTKVKICGITRVEDAAAAADAGTDAIGLVFYEDSPRHVSIDLARAITDCLPPFVSKVGLFVDADEDQVRTVLDNVNLDLLQFHGNEPAEVCRCYGLPYIKAVKMVEDLDYMAEERKYPDAAALLLDSHVEGMAGGSGVVFDWSLVPGARNKPVILAGGLNPDNVGKAVSQVQPYAVDVSGGVESGKGIKDRFLINEFINAVRDA